VLRSRRRLALAIVLAAIVLGFSVASCLVPSWGAKAILTPWHRSPPPEPTVAHENVDFEGDGVRLRGWRFPPEGVRRGHLVYLHGFGDDRRGAVGIAQRFTPLGFEVIAYDSRAHGQSEGACCTYGVAEKRDLARVLDREPAGPVVLLGGSLGGAVALECAADDPRISLVVAIAAFSDLRSVVEDRKPFFATRGQMESALGIAARDGGFRLEDASPVASAPRIRCPVLLVHGADDRDTPAEHSKRIHAALTGTKELILVPGMHHNDPVDEATWKRIEGAALAALSEAAAPR
jgi:pimeloyl-ACP methyl ester carboxylesterase